MSNIKLYENMVGLKMKDVLNESLKFDLLNYISQNLNSVDRIKIKNDIYIILKHTSINDRINFQDNVIESINDKLTKIDNVTTSNMERVIKQCFNNLTHEYSKYSKNNTDDVDYSFIYKDELKNIKHNIKIINKLLEGISPNDDKFYNVNTYDEVCLHPRTDGIYLVWKDKKFYIKDVRKNLFFMIDFKTLVNGYGFDKTLTINKQETLYLTPSNFKLDFIPLAFVYEIPQETFNNIVSEIVTNETTKMGDIYFLVK